MGALALSGYLGYSNFISVDVSNLHEVLAPMSVEESADGEESQEKKSNDFIWKIIETLSPLITPIIAGYKRKDKKNEIRTLDDDIGDIAVHLGVSKALIRGRLGLGDRRKNTTNKTMNKRRSVDKS
jgi:hypothetical protein